MLSPMGALVNNGDDDMPCSCDNQDMSIHSVGSIDPSGARRNFSTQGQL